METDVRVFPSIIAPTDTGSLGVGARAKLLREFGIRINEFEEFLALLQVRPVMRALSFNPRLDNKMETIPEDSERIIPVKPEVTPSMNADIEECGRFVERGAAALFDSFAEAGLESVARVGGMFAELSGQTARSLISGPGMIGQVRTGSDRALAALGAMNAPGALAASAALTVCARALGGARRYSSSPVESIPAVNAVGGSVPPGWDGHAVSVYVDGRKVSSPRELRALLAAGGVEYPLRRAFAGLMV